MMHESGTGGGPKYGIIPQMPLTDISSPVNILDNTTYSQPRVRLLFSLSLPSSSHFLRLMLKEGGGDR